MAGKAKAVESGADLRGKLTELGQVSDLRPLRPAFAQGVDADLVDAEDVRDIWGRAPSASRSFA